MDNSTKVDSPVNLISDILSQSTGIIPPEKPEEVTETPETLDEDPQESLEAQVEEPEEEIEHVFFNDILDDINIPIEDAYEMSLKMPDADPITLGALKNFYIDNKDIETQRQEIKQREQDLQVQAEAAQSVPQVSNELMQARAQVLAINEAYNGVNWSAIRQQNPAEWSAMQTEFQQKFAAAKARESAAMNQVDTQTQQARAYQQERLFESMPELKDDKTRQELALQVQKMTSDFGIAKNHLEKVEDANVMRMLITLSKMYAAKDTVKNKMEDKTPTSNKTAASRPQPSTRKLALKRLIDKAKSSKDPRDKTNAITALMG